MISYDKLLPPSGFEPGHPGMMSLTLSHSATNAFLYLLGNDDYV